MTIFNVGSTRAYTTINDTYFHAANGDTLLLDEGTYSEALYMRYKNVNFVGNTDRPEAGLVKMSQLLVDDYLLCIENIYSKEIYFEAINFTWSPNESVEESYDHPIEVKYSNDVIISFNKCILDASFYYKYIIDFYRCNNVRVNFYNCTFNYIPDTSFYSSSEEQFVWSANYYVMFDIKKCVFPYILENLSYHPEFPNGLQNNIANVSNTTASGFNDVYKMFNVDDAAYAYNSTCVIGQEYFIYVELDEPTLITKWVFATYYYFEYNLSGKVNFQGSNDLTTWQDAPTSYEKEKDSFNYGIFNTLFVVPYKYYRLKIEAVHSEIRIIAFSILGQGNDDIFFDYVQFPGEVGYGPKYGEYLLDIPKQYHFKGYVNDPALDNIVSDTVTWSTLNKPYIIGLSNNDKRATVSTSNKYTDCALRATSSRATGKWYWEFKSSSHYGECRVGFGTEQASVNAPLGSDSFSWGYEYRSGYIYNGDVVVSEGPPCVNDDIIGVAYDAYNGKIWFSKNNQWFFDGSPEMGTFPSVEVYADLFPMASLRSSITAPAVVDLIISTSDLNYPVPNGYSFYGSKIVWKIKAINAESNIIEGWTYSSPKDASYEVFTTYSGNHFLICEDAAEEPIYNDLMLGRFKPEEWYK